MIGRAAAAAGAGTALGLLSGGYKPPVGFYFRAGLIDQMALAKAGAITGMDLAPDSQFQEVSGLSMSLDVEPVIEGGNNDFVYQLPKQTKYDNLVLKRGLLTNGSGLAEWCYSTIQNGLNKKIVLKDLYIELISPNSLIPLMFWNISGAYPVKWDVTPFNSTESAIVTESLEFVYQKMLVIPTGAVSNVASMIL